MKKLTLRQLEAVVEFLAGHMEHPLLHKNLHLRIAYEKLYDGLIYQRKARKRKELDNGSSNTPS